jgi:hypothetical protein
MTMKTASKTARAGSYYQAGSSLLAAGGSTLLYKYG